MDKVTKWSVIIYVRLSDEDNSNPGEESRSIENQIKHLELYVEIMKSKGENISKHKIIYDDGRTGTDINRSGFQEVIRLLESKQYNCLLISDLSRGFRNISDQTYYLEEYFPLHNIRFISTTLQYVDNYLFPQSALNLGVKIQGITNEQFAYDTSIKIRSKFDSKRKLGEFIGSFAPYGYNKKNDNSNVLIVDEEASKIVKDIFDWYVNKNMSLSAITKKLNGMGIPNPTKYKNQRGLNLRNPNGNDGLWSPSTVGRMLANEVYLGKMIQGKSEIINYKVHKARSVPKEQWYVVEDTHEPIIDKEIFKKAQDLLSLNTRAGTKQNIYPLGGMLKCGECQKAMTRNRSKNNVYYVCSTSAGKGTQFCKPHSIREDILFSAVLEAVNLQILQISDMQYLYQRIKDVPKKRIDASSIRSNIEMSKRELGEEVKTFDRSYYDLSKDVISEEQFIRIRKMSEKRQNELKITLNNLLSEMNNVLSSSGIKSAYFDKFVKRKGIEEFTRGLAVDLIDRVYVYDNKSVEVKFKFIDQFLLI